MKKYRYLILGSAANVILSVPHVWPQTGANFAIVRTGMAIARLIHGVLEFLAFVLSTFFGGANASVQFVVLLLIVPLTIHLFLSAWRSNEEASFYLSLALAGNIIFGMVTVWAGSLPVTKTAECLIEQNGVAHRIIEFSEEGWLPEFHYFLAVAGEGAGEWEHVAKRTHSDPIQDPCRQIRNVFPDLDRLMDTTMQPNNR